MALALKRNGITHIRPRHGGIALWMDRLYPVEKIPVGETVGG